MNLIDLIIVPLAFGLIGFIEPCVIGMNAIFLSYVVPLGKRKRIIETTKFTAVRAIFLSALGLLVALISQKIFVFKRSYNTALGIFFIILGAIYIASKFKPMPMPNISLLKGKQNEVSYGVVFGLSIPACAMPLFLALLSKSAGLGDLLLGAVSLFVFGLGLSAPLLVMSYSDRANKWLENIAKGVNIAPIIGGLALIIVGAYTILQA
ncbi:MAG: cytochrome c biogenesis CcdA family protein [Candidatus Hydrothermarchaeales archaeon]